VRLTVCIATVLCTVQVSAARAVAADTSLAAGIRQVQSGEFEPGIATLADFVKKASGDRTRSKDLVQAYLWIGVAYVRLREERKAMDTLLDAIRQDEGLSLSEEDVPPEFLKVFRKAKEEAGRNRPSGAASGPGPTSLPPSTPPAPAGPRPPSAALATAFIDRVRVADFATVREMMKENPGLLKVKDAEFQATPLHWAALKGHEAVAALLLDEGADVEARNRDGETPIDVARRSGRTNVLKLFPPDIIEAARSGDLAIVQRFVEKDRSLVGRKDPEFGATPLHWAALKGHVDVVRYLLASGADASATNRQGETALKVAQRAEHSEVVRVLTSPR